MKTLQLNKRTGLFLVDFWKRILIFLAVFGPATITAMADNDASGVATYSIAGATLGYPILFLLCIITILLAITQEMGVRLSIISRRGLADLIREKYGVRISMLIFTCLVISNLGTIIVDLAAVKTTSQMLHLPSIPMVIAVVLVSFWFITKGNYKLTQNIMLASCVFFLTYIASAVMSKPDWGLAISNLAYPHGVPITADYLKNYLIIGMGVLGTTITPWGQFFISSFAFDKKIDKGQVIYSQFETYWGALLTNIFSFFMIVATAATLFLHKIPLVSGEQAALSIQPFAGKLAGTFFAVGIMNAGFIGIITISLCTAYAFSEFFGVSGSLNDTFERSKSFYILFLLQLIISGAFVLLPGISLFQIVMATQILNAVMLPLIFFYLIKLTSDKAIMGEYANKPFQKYFAIICTVVIMVASAFTIVALFKQ